MIEEASSVDTQLSTLTRARNLGTSTSKFGSIFDLGKGRALANSSGIRHRSPTTKRFGEMNLPIIGQTAATGQKI